MKYFTKDEFKCKHCGQNEIKQDFLDLLDKAREISNVPYVITSGYRCPAHNQAIGSTAPNHPSGRAADIKAQDGQIRIAILRGLILAGFKRIGLHKDFIHADNMDSIDSCWFY